MRSVVRSSDLPFLLATLGARLVVLSSVATSYVPWVPLTAVHTGRRHAYRQCPRSARIASVGVGHAGSSTASHKHHEASPHTVAAMSQRLASSGRHRQRAGAASIRASGYETPCKDTPLLHRTDMEWLICVLGLYVVDFRGWKSFDAIKKSKLIL